MGSITFVGLGSLYIMGLSENFPISIYQGYIS
jgi:hypothetical protein